MTRFTKFIDFVEVGHGLGLEDPAGMLSSFLISMCSINGSRKGEIGFSWKSLTKCVVICTTNDHIINEGFPKIFEFTFSVRYEIVKTLAFKLSIREYFTAGRMTFFLGLMYSENLFTGSNFISTSAESKEKYIVDFPIFWSNTC